MADGAEVPGTLGYAAQAQDLLRRYEALPFRDKHASILYLLPQPPGRVLDVGAGTGADAAWLASRGHAVVAVEPTAALRSAGMALHPSPAIEWLDDALPGLDAVRARGQRFEAILLSAVWMHLDAPERRLAMRRLAALLAPGGVLVITLRHGPVPAGRRMFDVAAEETIELAQRRGLQTLLHLREPSLQPANRAAGVTWTRLAFRAG